MTDKEQTELVEILQDTAESICGEWCDGSHEGAEAVKEHLSKERQALLNWRDKAVKSTVKTLEANIARYGDGTIVYFNGEAVVPISVVLAQFRPSQRPAEALTQPEGEK